MSFSSVGFLYASVGLLYANSYCCGYYYCTVKPVLVESDTRIQFLFNCTPVPVWPEWVGVRGVRVHTSCPVLPPDFPNT